MLNLIPEELLTTACQLVCYGFVTVTAMVAYMFVPRI